MAQDLTLLETSVIAAFGAQIERRSGKRPRMLIAGDSGQRVRPTGFEWNRVSGLMKRVLERPMRRQTDEHVRCPEKIVRVVDGARGLYGNVEKQRRPTRQRGDAEGEHVEGHLLQVAATSRQEAADLVDRLVTNDSVTVLTPALAPSDWVQPESRSGVLDAAAAKGLECQTAVVLECGANILERSRSRGTDATSPLEEEQERTAVDRLRVCLSRATETLVSVDVDEDEGETACAGAGLLRFDGATRTPHRHRRALGRRTGARERRTGKAAAARRRGRGAPSRCGNDPVERDDRHQRLRWPARAEGVARPGGLLAGRDDPEVPADAVGADRGRKRTDRERATVPNECDQAVAVRNHRHDGPTRWRATWPPPRCARCSTGPRT